MNFHAMFFFAWPLVLVVGAYVAINTFLTKDYKPYIDQIEKEKEVN
jgi:hypothetical protein